MGLGELPFLQGPVDTSPVPLSRQILYFLRGFEVSKPPSVGSIPDDEEADLVEIRKDWELILLRRKVHSGH